MNRQKVIRLIIDTYTNSVGNKTNVFGNTTNMANVLLVLFKESIEKEQNIDIQKCFILNTLYDMVACADIEDDYLAFSKASGLLAERLNEVGLHGVWRMWLTSQLDDESLEMRLVMGCRNLATILNMADENNNQYFTEDEIVALIARIDEYCLENNILNELLVKEL
jgi:hypothetical protein